MSEMSDLPPGCVIRPEREEQRAAVEDLHRLAFGGPLEAAVIARIRRSPQFMPELSLVTQHAEQVVGHVLFSRVHLRDAAGRLRPVVLLAPLAVRAEWSGLGIGSALVRTGLARLHELEQTPVVVRGHPDFYRRLGFMPAEQAGLLPPAPLPPNEYSVLRPSDLTSPTGTLVYPPAFEVLGYPVEPQ